MARFNLAFGVRALAVVESVAWLEKLTPAKRARFLALLSHNLTIAIRVVCHAAGPAEATVERIRLLNEAHHRSSSYLAHYHGDDEDSMWIQCVVECLLSGSDRVVQEQIEQAWAYAQNVVDADI